MITRYLTAGANDSRDNAAPRIELAMKIKARVRLGEGRVRTEKPELPPLNSAEQAHYDELRVLPFGCWLEFAINQQGDVVRPRLSWHCRITDNALFVNQRGQRVAEQILDSLARLMAGRPGAPGHRWT